MLEWVFKNNAEHIQSCQLGGDGHYPLRFSISSFLAHRIKKRIGLSKVQFSVTAAAPIQMETLEFWAGLNVPLYEAFGMSESCGIALFSTPLGRQVFRCRMSAERATYENRLPLSSYCGRTNHDKRRGSLLLQLGLAVARSASISTTLESE